MGQQWEYNGISLNTKAWQVIEVSGLGTPKTRGNNIEIPYKNGKRNTKKYYDEKPLIFGMVVNGVDPITGIVPAGKTGNEQLHDNIDYLNLIFGRRGEFTLKRIMPNGNVREAKAEVYGDTDYTIKDMTSCKFTVEFLLADPFFYSATKVTELRNITEAQTTFAHQNMGNAPALKHLITLTGPLANPVIENLSNGVWLQYLGVINNGETVIIDTENFNCFKGSLNVISALKHAGDINWLILEPGQNNIKIISETVGGSVQIEYYPPYF